MFSGETADTFIIAKYWTLNDLFPPAEATTAWDGEGNPNGHAIVASTNTLSTGRNTELRITDPSLVGTKLQPTEKYYIHNGIWKLSGGGNGDAGSSILFPESYFVISHPVSITQSTSYTNVGEVSVLNLNILLRVNQTAQGSQDNFIAIPRPVDVPLNSLNLKGTSAFTESTNTLSTGRNDEILLFDNAVAISKKQPSKTYYVHNGIWKLSGGGNTDRGLETIPANTGFILRKVATTSGDDSIWINTPSY